MILLHDEYADTIDEKVDEIVEDKGRDIQSDLEYELEAQLSDGIDEKYSNDITSAVREYADDVLPDMVREGIYDTDEFTNFSDTSAKITNLEDKVHDIEATQEASLEPELSHDVDELKSKVSHIEATLQDKVESLDTSLISALDEDMGVVKAKVEALVKFIEVLVDKQSMFFDEVEISSDRLKDIAILTNHEMDNALNELKEDK